MRHIRKISDYAVIGGLSAVVILALSGCDDGLNKKSDNSQSSDTKQSIKNGALVILEEQSDGTYKIAEEYPSGETRVIIREISGAERMLSKEEIDALIKEEEARIDNNQSELTNPTGSGLGLGGAILASAAGAILGSYIGNKLFNNANYQNQQARNYKSPQAYERSKNSFNNKASGAGTSGSGKKGFFGGSSSGSSSGSSGNAG